NDARKPRVAYQRERRADQPCRLRQQPADAAHLVRQRLADIDRGVAAGETLGKAAADRERQRIPLRLGQQRTEPQVAELACAPGGEKRLARGGLRKRFASPHDLVRKPVSTFRDHADTLYACFLFGPGRKFNTRAPSLIAPAICDFGTESIWV